MVVKAWLSVVVCVPALVACAFGCAAKPVEAVEGASANLSTDARAKTSEYLDSAASSWVSKSDWGFVQGGRCVMSCHTTVPFMMARKKLPAEVSATSALGTVRGYVEARVNNWQNVAPLYAWVPQNSRGTESVVNMVALVSDDVSTGDHSLSDVAKRALAAMWNEQQADGSFMWWDSFSLAPWENTEAKVWGNALAAFTVGKAPATYLESLSAGDRAKAEKLDAYLRARATDSAHPEPLHNRAMILLASTTRPILDSSTKDDIATAIRAAQSSDGSFSAGSLGLSVAGGAAAAARPHAYATAFFTYVLREAADTTGAVANGQAWLEAHQRADGAWESKSLNKPSATFNNQIATDAATAWSVLALSP